MAAIVCHISVLQICTGQPSPPPPPRPTLITIEGTIGAGKSTVMRALRDTYRGDHKVAFVDEPVDKWIGGSDGVNLLDAMYQGELAQPAFQLMALATRVGPTVRALRSSPVVIAERSMWSDQMVFAERGLIEPATRAAYNLGHAALREAFPADLREILVLLDVPIEVALQRIAERGRPEEAGIDAKYLQQLEEGHERLATLRAADLIRVDASESSDSVVRKVVDEVRRLLDADEPSS